MKISREGWILFVLGSLDLISTLIAVRAGIAVEGNPLMSFFLEKGYLPFILVKLTSLILPISLLEQIKIKKPEEASFVKKAMKLAILAYIVSYILCVWAIN